MTAVEMRERVRAMYAEIGLNEAQAKDLEIGVFNSTLMQADKGKTPKNWSCPTFKQLYLAKARNIYQNLENPQLLSRLLEEEFVPHELAVMRPENIHPDLWNPVVEAEIRRRNASYELSRTQITDMFRCGKCKKNKCSYYEIATRSADEPLSIFVSCMHCGNRWRMG